MRILLINPPHPSIGSRIPREHLPPLGLLALGGPLLDAGHQVKLLDAEFGPMPLDRILSETIAYGPDAVLLGHSGSTSAHPAATRIARAVRMRLPDVWIIYGGVFPTYHWPEIMAQEPAFDFIGRGEGEETVVRLVKALEQKEPLERVPGIVFRAGTAPGPTRLMPNPPGADGKVVANPPAPIIRDLDACRVGWELIDHRRHVPNWRVLLWVKFIEAVCQLRPKSLLRLLAHPDQVFRAGMRWYSNIGRRVWPYEICQWLWFDRRTSHGPTLAKFLKGAWDSEPVATTRRPAVPTPEPQGMVSPSRPLEILQPGQTDPGLRTLARLGDRQLAASPQPAEPLSRP